MFITFEGIDGVGKTYLLEKLYDWFIQENLPVLKTREPGGTKLGEKIRELVQHGESMNSKTESLLFAASRAEHIEKVIIPALEEGMFVLCDRFIDSSLAYQGGGRNLGMEEIQDLNLWAVDGIEPDLTFLIVNDKEHSLDNISELEPDRFEKEGVEFQKTVLENYKELAKLNKDRIFEIDNSKLDNTALNKMIEIVKTKSKES